MAQIKQATLWSPTGQAMVVPVGSELASALQKQGWNLDKGKAATYLSSTANATNAANTELQKKTDDYINSLGFSDEQKQMLKTFAANNFKTQNKVLTPAELDKSLQDAITNSTTDLTPYYTTKSAQEIEDFKNKMADIRNSAARYNQQEQLSYQQLLDKTRQSLKNSGMYFSGLGRKTLGAAGGLVSNGLEGTVPTKRRYDIEDANASYQQQARDLGTAAEREFGSANVNNLQGEIGTIANPYATGTTYDPNATRALYQANKQGTTGYVDTGNLELQKKKDILQSAFSRFGTANKQ